MKRILACLMSVCLILCFLPSMAFAAQQGDITYVSKSKEATELDSDFNSQITLSLPSAEEQLVTDVVFVLDKSTSTVVEDEALEMLKNLEKQASDTGAKIKAGVVIFNKTANEAIGLTELNAESLVQIENAMRMEISGGTNLHAGILAGKKMLDEDTSVDSNRKYMVVISDGITYMFNEEPTAVAWSWIGDTVQNFAGPDNWYSKYGTNDAPADWDAYMSNIEKLVNQDNGRYDYPYGGQIKEATDPAETQNHAMSIDKAFYLSYQAYKAAEAQGYHCYSMNAQTGTSYQWGPSFMDYLAGGKNVDFGDIQNDIAYAVSTGSYVTDIMGNGQLDGKNYNFDFINDIEKIDVLLGGKALDKTVISDNHYGFGKTADGYSFELIYYPEGASDTNGQEAIKWFINQNISNFQRAQLVYNVHLANPQTAPGVYGQYDKNGSQNLEGLYTNNSAVIYPVDSNGVPGQPEVFNKPTVSYTIAEQPEEPQDPTEPQEPTDPQDPTTPQKPEDPSVPGDDNQGDDNGNGTSAPKTSDANDMATPLLIAFASMTAFSVFMRKYKKFN